MNYNRIIITGDSGRGKSTLALKLGKKLGIPVHSTDDYFWEIKFSKPRDRQESIEQVSGLYSGDKWIIEGTTQHLLIPGLDRADVIIYLHYTNIFSQWISIIRRSRDRDNQKISEILPLLKHVFFKRYKLGYKKGKMTQIEMVAPYKNKVITLSSFAEINQFVGNL